MSYIYEIEVEDFLEHFGVKGQKWGVRKAKFKKNRALNKASRAKDRAEWAKEVESARVKVASGKLQRDLKAAKTEAKAKKEKIGSREARKIVSNQRELNREVMSTASSFKNGKEAALGILIAVGAEYVSSN